MLKSLDNFMLRSLDNKVYAEEIDVQTLIGVLKAQSLPYRYGLSMQFPTGFQIGCVTTPR